MGLLLSLWRLDPLAIAACIATAVVLVARRTELGPRSILLGSAVVVLVAALASPIGSLAEGYLFSAHMLQHLLLVLVVPPLALLGWPARRGERPAQTARRRLHPLVPWLLGVGAMWLWHEPKLCDAASSSPAVHRVQELSLLAMGTAFWWPVLAPRAGAPLSPLAGILYLFTACVACTLLGIVITFSPVEVCSVFAHPVDRLGVMPLVRDGWGLSPEKDQQVGGLLMWVPACLVYGVGIMGQLARLFAEHDVARQEEPS
ncbi:MAG TPA: cytochrome c oxidase assembly protein [Polyangiaceae bacterium]|nr:cytochrome c oxidase assembly protein [Polyangiaceae bacterium]